VTKHRVTCETPGCGRVWRENCADCAQDTAERHRAETGHDVRLQISSDDTSMWELREMTRRARMVLVPKRGW
jgi:hypothetical protein